MGNVAGRDEFPDIVGYEGCQVLDERDISDAFTCDDIAQHDRVIHALQVVTHLAFIGDVVMAKSGKSADL